MIEKRSQLTSFICVSQHVVTFVCSGSSCNGHLRLTWMPLALTLLPRMQFDGKNDSGMSDWRAIFYAAWHKRYHSSGFLRCALSCVWKRLKVSRYCHSAAACIWRCATTNLLFPTSIPMANVCTVKELKKIPSNYRTITRLNSRCAWKKRMKKHTNGTDLVV